jgi:hypothetical protein
MTHLIKLTLLFLLIVPAAIAKPEIAQNPPKTSPCKDGTDFRQFDFWVGEWDVKPTQAETGPTVGASKIERLVDGCVIQENWESPGFTGKSWNYYDRAAKRWHQVWIDVTGRRADYAGEYKENSMQFEGEVTLANGTKFKTKMTFFNLGPNKVRQFAQRSTDEGKTWTTTVDLTYIRKA